jgi:hypothetical protein
MTTEELRDNIVEYLEINRHIDVDGNIKIKESEKTVIKALIEQAKSEWILEELVKAKSLTEHLSQEERNEYFDLIIRNLMNDKT